MRKSVSNKWQLVRYADDTMIYSAHQYNKTRTSKVGAISKAQKAQNIFFEKNLEFSKIFLFRKMSHSAEKCKRGPFLIYKHAFCCKIKNPKGDPLGQ